MKALLSKWWPGRVDRLLWEERLSSFYEQNEAYHAMTSSGDKSTHPQVRFLLKRLKSEGVYAEIGCGGGLVASQAARRGAVVKGFDVAPIAIESARKKYGSQRVSFDVASAYEIPLPDSSVDGVWSFEVLEHLWEPVRALEEMVRLVKPGGFIFITCPNFFSLDLHLNKRWSVRLVEVGVAVVRFWQDRIYGRLAINVKPDIVRDDVYPDCDLVSSLVPCNITLLTRKLGCKLEQLDLFYMRNNMAAGNSKEDQPGGSVYIPKWMQHLPVIRCCGDHVFMWLVKGSNETLS